MTIEEISLALAHLAAELHAINANLTSAAPIVAPVIPVPVPSHTLPPRPSGPGSGAANHLANILNGGHGGHISPEEQAKRDARQRAVMACNEATRAMAMASVQRIVTPRPNLQDFINDPNYHWPGWDIIAAAQAHPGPGTHVPRPI
jgi:hypothetical protein